MALGKSRVCLKGLWMIRGSGIDFLDSKNYARIFGKKIFWSETKKK